jgi:CRP/FNR family cyclic AMP-dependent transcriptional regulator
MDQREVASIPLFAGLSKDDQKVIAQYADDVDVPAGTKLAQEGRFAYEFFAILDGNAEVTREGAAIATLGPGDFFGEIGLLSSERRVASVTATSPMRLAVLTGAQLRAIESRMAPVGQRIRAAMSERLGADETRTTPQ